MEEGVFIADQLKRMLSMLGRELSGLPDPALNHILEFQPSNTLFQLGTHVAGSTRFWAITCQGGRDFDRNRDAEFISTGEGAALLADLDDVVASVHAFVSAMTADDLDQPVTVSSASISFWPSSDPLPRRHALLHALEHTGLHVGHAQLTRQLLGFSSTGMESTHE